MEIASLLPLDVFDLIIDTIHSTDGTKYLKVLSLVSKNLCLLARTHMFRKLSLDLPKMKQIYDYIGDGSRQPLPTALSSVRNLHVRALEASPSPVDRKYLEVLRFFSRVIHLHISDWYFQDFDKNDVTRLLGHFGATVATLNLQQSFFDSEVLIFLTPMFTLVNNLSVNPRDLSELETYKIRDADRSKSVAFKGRLEFTCLHPIHDQFLAFINQNCSVVTSIIVYYCESGGKLQELFDLQGGNLTFVDVGVPGGGDPISLSHCTNLRTLHISLGGAPFSPDKANREILRSITSPHLEVIWIHDFTEVAEGQSVEEWAEVDDLLCKFCDRSYPERFGVYFLFDEIESEDYDNMFYEYASRIWPRFSEKGDVELWFSSPPLGFF